MRQVYKYCHLQKKVVEADEAVSQSQLANIKHGYIPDEMPATKHPVTGEYFTSKAKFREVTRSRGYEEVGTAYENGYEPERHHREELRERTEALKREYKERLRS